MLLPTCQTLKGEIFACQLQPDRARVNALDGHGAAVSGQARRSANMSLDCQIPTSSSCLCEGRSCAQAR